MKTWPCIYPSQVTAGVLLALVGTPLLWSLGAALVAGCDGAAWRALSADTQTRRALGLSLWTGLLATALSVAGAAYLLSRSVGRASWPVLVRALSPMLAMPHAALAIGLAFLLAPSGWLLRALSPWATGLVDPPPWLTTQDPWGLGLIAVLVAKEIPFLLWAAASQLQRAEVTQRWRDELGVARSLGYGPHAAWWRVLWPQLWPRLRWPMLAVLAYSLTVVDMALVIGPTSPPTLAVLAWQWLLDADLSVNARGAAAAWLLACVVLLTAALAWQVLRWRGWRRRWSNGQRGAAAVAGQRSATVGLTVLAATYGAVMLALALGSVAGSWPFPALLPQTLTGQAWAAVADSFASVGSTLTLGLASAGTALLWSIAWLEAAPARLRERLRWLLYLPLLLPPVLWVLGLQRLALGWGLDASWTGVWLAHTLAALPYVMIALSPAYTGFEVRYQQVTASLGHGRMVFLWRVKWPLLRAALASALAVGFAVSVAQYLPTLFVGAGRFATVTTEAVTLAAGAQRSLTAAYAWLQWLLPVAVFALAAWVGKPRRYEKK